MSDETGDTQRGGGRFEGRARGTPQGQRDGGWAGGAGAFMAGVANRMSRGP